MLFIIEGLALGFGLAIDAFSVAAANGIKDPDLKKSKLLFMSGIFGLFQALMPILGWIFVNSIVSVFEKIKIFLPWISFAVLLFFGLKMIIEGISKEEERKTATNLKEIFFQGIATSLDALSVGFTIALYPIIKAGIESMIIGVVTFVLTLLGAKLGKKIGKAFSQKASIAGGIILILVGIEIVIEHFITG